VAAKVGFIVGDFVASLHTDEHLRQSHRRLIDVLRASRPIDATSQAPEWNNTGNTPTSSYVRDYSAKHIQCGWDPDWENDEHAIKQWVGDCPQDDIVKAAASVLGFEKLRQLCSKAEAGDTFEFAKLAAAAGLCAQMQQGSDRPAAIVLQLSALDALGALAETKGSESRNDEERLELELLGAIMPLGDPANFKYLPRECISISSAVCPYCPDL
jgi:hypothetical protein